MQDPSPGQVDPGRSVITTGVHAVGFWRCALLDLLYNSHGHGRPDVHPLSLRHFKGIRLRASAHAPASPPPIHSRAALYGTGGLTSHAAPNMCTGADKPPSPGVLCSSTIRSGCNHNISQPACGRGRSAQMGPHGAGLFHGGLRHPHPTSGGNYYLDRARTRNLPGHLRNLSNIQRYGTSLELGQNGTTRFCHRHLH
jgi:hypothetical protein